jgi:hypothetical protein
LFHWLGNAAPQIGVSTSSENAYPSRQFGRHLEEPDTEISNPIIPK